VHGRCRCCRCCGYCRGKAGRKLASRAQVCRVSVSRDAGVCVCPHASTVYMCPRTAIYVSSGLLCMCAPFRETLVYMCVLVLSYMRVLILLYNCPPYCYICVLILVYMCPQCCLYVSFILLYHFPPCCYICVLILLCVCLHTASCQHTAVCVLIGGRGTLMKQKKLDICPQRTRCVLMQLDMCPHTTTSVSSYN
jgi:hypothetical protein